MTISRALAYTILSYAKSGNTADEAVARVFGFMKKRGLEGFGSSVLEELSRLIARETKRETLKLYSPFPLDDEAKAAIKNHYHLDANHKTEEVIDETFIGGFRAEHDHRYHDATLKQALTRLEQKLLQH